MFGKLKRSWKVLTPKTKRCSIVYKLQKIGKDSYNMSELTLKEKIDLVMKNIADEIRIFPGIAALHTIGSQHNSSSSVSQFPRNKEGKPSDHLEDLLDRHLQIGRWAWMADLDKAQDERMCKEWIVNCLAYGEYNHNIISDEEFDNNCRQLLSRYDGLPEWFTKRVDKERLRTGTTSGMTYTQEEHDEVKRILRQ